MVATPTSSRLPLGLSWIVAFKVVAGLVVVVVLFQLPQFLDPADTLIVNRALYIAIAAMGLNLLTGYNGQVSIGHGAFFGLGAYTSAILVTDHGWSFYASLPAAAALCFVVGAAIGFPALRVKGLYLALLTLGVAALFPDLAIRFVRGVGGTQQVQVGSPDRVRPGWADFFEQYATERDQWHYYVTFFVAALMLLVLWGLVRGRFGRSLIAVRDHEAAASTVGIDAARVKVSAFAISALYAGVAGALSVLALGNYEASKFEVFQQSITFLVAVVIGGTATVLGPVLGAFAVVYLDDNTKTLIEGKEILSPALFGAILIAFMYVLPDGIVGGARRFGAMAARRLRGRAPEPSST